MANRGANTRKLEDRAAEVSSAKRVITGRIPTPPPAPSAPAAIEQENAKSTTAAPLTAPRA